MFSCHWAWFTCTQLLVFVSSLTGLISPRTLRASSIIYMTAESMTTLCVLSLSDSPFLVTVAADRAERHQNRYLTRSHDRYMNEGHMASTSCVAMASYALPRLVLEFSSTARPVGQHTREMYTHYLSCRHNPCRAIVSAQPLQRAAISPLPSIFGDPSSLSMYLRLTLFII